MRQTWGKNVAIVLAFALAITPLFAATANAALLSPRKLTLKAGATDGGSKPSGVVNHEFSFTIPPVFASLVSLKKLASTS